MMEENQNTFANKTLDELPLKCKRAQKQNIYENLMLNMVSFHELY